MEQGPTTTSKRESSPLRMARIDWRWAETCAVSAAFSGSWFFSARVLGRRCGAGWLSIKVTGLDGRSDRFFAATDEFMSWASWPAGVIPRGPTGVFDNLPYWPYVLICHLTVTDRRRQAVP